MMLEVRELGGVLERVARRLGAAAAIGTVVRAAVGAATGLLAWALVTLAVPVPFPLPAAAAAAALALAAAYPVLAWRLRPSLAAAARLTDRRLGLADRLGTAVDLLSRPGSIAGLARLQIADAVRAARGVDPRMVAPIRIPREAWVVVAGCVLLGLWAQFLLGWSFPGTPAARTLAVVHGEGRVLEEIGRRLAAAGARGLPGARRAAPRVQELGRRLASPQVTRRDAVAVLQNAGRQLAAAQETVERRLLAALPTPAGAPGAPPPVRRETGAQRLRALEDAVRQLRAVTGQLHPGGAPVDRADVSRRLRALSESLDQMGAPPEIRRSVAAARREADRANPSAAGRSLGDALQDLQALERMLGDEQALGEARRQVQQSSERIAESGPLGGSNGHQDTEPGGSSPTSPQAPGNNPVVPTSDEAPPPPPGPHQGSLPGQGSGGTPGAPTPHLAGTRTPVQVPGIQGQGTSSLKEITAPGQTGTPRLPAGRPPAAVTHELDRALLREPLPPAYLVVIRRYFETLGGTP